WIEAYGGGWQVLLPNGGDATVEHGVEWGFHGEAGLGPWGGGGGGATRGGCSPQLVRAPPRPRRAGGGGGPGLPIEGEGGNGSDEAIEVMWGHHPAFGAPFLEPGCTISAPARFFHSDDRTPGTALAAGVVSDWPHVALEEGGTVDLSVIPPEGERRAVLGYL